MDIDTLSFLLDKIISQKNKDIIFKKAKKQLGHDIISYKELLNVFLKSAAKGAGKRIIDLSTTGFLTLL